MNQLSKLQNLKHSFTVPYVSKIFYLKESQGETKKSMQETRFPVNAGITGYVAATGDTVNITDPYKDARFDQTVDANTDFKHSTILAMPIRHTCSPGKVQGVFQLVNKVSTGQA